MRYDGLTKVASGQRTKLVWLAVLVPSLYLLEWVLIGFTAALVAFLKYHDISDGFIWILMWGLNLLYSGTIVLFSDHSQIDITLMETLRKWTDTFAEKWRWSARFLEFLIVIRLLFWDGPCRLLIYFRQRLSSSLLRGCLFVGASGLQMFVWVKLYVLGYESIGDLLKAVW